MIRFARTLLILVALICPALAGGKAPKLYIGFHPEGSSEEGPRLVRPDIVSGKTRYFRISPELSVRHFSSYSAFAAEDGATWGAKLVLNDDGKRAMEVMVSTYQGKLVRILVNGRAVDILKIDRNSGDGEVVIWQGLTKQDLILMDKQLRRVGGEDPAKL